MVRQLVRQSDNSDAAVTAYDAGALGPQADTTSSRFGVRRDFELGASS